MQRHASYSLPTSVHVAILEALLKLEGRRDAHGGQYELPVRVVLHRLDSPEATMPLGQFIPRRVSVVSALTLRILRIWC